MQLYGTRRADRTEHVNAEAGLLIIARLPILSAGPSKTSAYGDNDKPIEEEDKAPVSSFYRSHIPHATD
jgi:hypothetical protein